MKYRNHYFHRCAKPPKILAAQSWCEDGKREEKMACPKCGAITKPYVTEIISGDDPNMKRVGDAPFLK